MPRGFTSGHTTQLELPLKRVCEPDRNSRHGGRSFYFFDFDENVAFLTTPTYLFHRETRAQVPINSRELCLHRNEIGKSGRFADYIIDLDPETGSFQAFRDKDLSLVERILFWRRQAFVTDLNAALGLPDVQWKGPSWNCFYHAVFNSRPLALITARGHAPSTIRSGIELLVKNGHLPRRPNYLAIYPVSHPQTKSALNLPDSHSIPHLKQRALRAAVLKAFQVYGKNPYHRFGMSDDDPQNCEWILEEMRALKREFPNNSFFLIQTHGEQSQKIEVFADGRHDRMTTNDPQMNLF